MIDDKQKREDGGEGAGKLSPQSGAKDVSVSGAKDVSQPGGLSKTGELPGDKVPASDAPPAITSAVPGLDFMREQIKKRPTNTKKLLRRTIITALMAVIFGFVACFTLVILEPVLNNRMHPQEEAEMVVLPPETVEVLPADLPKKDEDIPSKDEGNSNPGTGSSNNNSNLIPGDKTADAGMGTGEEGGLSQADVAGEALIRDDPIESLSDSYTALQALVERVSFGLVTITTVASDDNWLEGSVESTGQSTGAIVANTIKYVLILARTYDVSEAEEISVTFHNGTVAEAKVRMADPTTGIAILEASKENLDDYALESVQVAELGNSNSSTLKGGPVIALGSPMGKNNSVCYGVITGTGVPIQTVDSRYRLILTDIYGSQMASGFLTNMQGQIIGVINQDYNDSDLKNMISAIGISELRTTIERLSNRKKQAYLGLTTADVTTQIHEERGIPIGAYVTRVAMDSPALIAGIQSGDVIIAIGDKHLTSQAEYIEILSTFRPQDEVTITLMRESRGEYQELNISATLADLGE